MSAHLLSLARQRYAVRNYTSQPVPDDVLQYIVEVARMAPSAVNYQPWSFVVVREPHLLQQLHAVYHREWFRTAPCCIVVCGNHGESWHRGADGKDHCDIDIAIATEHMSLAATECGLGSCWVQIRRRMDAEGNVAEDNVRNLLGIPAHYAVLSIVAVGHKAREAKPFDEEKMQWDKIHIGNCGGK